jgi:hypothetical protein
LRLYCASDANFTDTARLTVIIVNVNALLAEMVAILAYLDFALDCVGLSNLINGIVAV